MACETGHLEVVRHLKGNKNSLKDAKNDYGPSTLHFARSNGHLGVVNRLLESGVDLNVKDNSLQISLYFACHSGHLEVVNRLEKLRILI